MSSRIALLACLVLAGCAAWTCASGCGSKKLTCPEGAVLIPTGTFMMGEPEMDSLLWARPVHKVTITKPYCMDRTEATNALFSASIRAKRCEYPYNKALMAEHYPNHPADYVNWEDAVCYCRGRGGRLPTEAEWEFAARGTDGRRYPWGNEPPTPEHWHIRLEPGPMTVRDVATHPKGRSFFGLEDMAGNLNEWTADPCKIYSAKATVDPKSGDLPSEHDANCRVLKGGPWSARAERDARAGMREPAHRLTRDDQAGVRCAYDPK